MTDSSAIDDTLAEARDLLLGDMASHVLNDVNGHIHADVSGFHEAFFISDCSRARECHVRARQSLEKRSNQLWKDETAPFVKRAFVQDVFSRIRGISGQTGKEYVGRNDPRLENIDFQGKPDFVLVSGQRSGTDPRSIWDDVLALGSVRELSSRGYQQAFLQLCHQAQAVFHHQPTRRFIHAFSIYGFTLEFLVFDRAGVISSEPTDLHRDDGYRKLLEALYQYSSMSDEQLGLGSFVQEDEAGKFVELLSVHDNSPQKLYTDGEPIAWPASLLTFPGAYCLQAKTSTSATTPDIVVKFIWEPPSDREEVEILKHATRSGVWGVPEVLGYRRLASTEDMRKTLQLGPKRRIQPESIQRPSLGEEMFDDKRDEAQATTDKFDIQKNCLRANTVEEDHHHPHGSSSHSAEHFELTCIATTPRGRPLSSFKSISEALCALRDAVKAHQSLQEKAGILHCDISTNNIIIPDSTPDSNDQAPRGILIDFDESIDLNASHETIAVGRDNNDDEDVPGHQAIEIRGTRPFIATSLMLGTSPTHTYLHDLESLLYVLIHLAICNHSHEPPMTSCLNSWAAMDDWRELGRRKESMVKTDDGWRRVREEFGRKWEAAGVGGLADELRALVVLGEEIEREELYRKVVEAFERTIDKAERAEI